MSDEQPTVEEEKSPKGLPGEFYTFDLVAHPYLLDQREQVEANPHEHVMYDGLRRLSEFLLGIDDYDLVRRVCQIEESDYERKGIGQLVRLPGVPRLYTSGEEYQDFLLHIERLMLMHIGGRDRRSPLYPFYHENLGRRPYPLLLYALSLAPLGHHGRYVGHAFLDYAHQLDRDCPGLVYVLDAYRNADLFYRHWEERGEKK